MLLDKRRQQFADFFDWNDGVLDSLFNEVSPNNVNGLSIVPFSKMSTQFDYFGAVTRFFSDAMLSDMPVIPQPYAALMENLTEHWAVTGEAILVGGNGQYRAIRPDYVYPVFDNFDRDKINKFLFVFPKNEYHDFKNRLGYAKEARVIEYDVATGRATVAVRVLRGDDLADTPVGESIDIGRVFWIKTNDGVYYKIRGIVREVIVRLNILQRFLNSVSNSLLQIDKDAISGGIFERGISQSVINEEMDKGLGLTVDPPFVGESEPKYIERLGTGLTESMEYLRMLLGQLGVISGVPDYVFGVQLGRPANETERVLFAGQSKVNRFRRNLELVFNEIGQPVKLGAEPFVTYKQKVETLVEEYKNGLITREEYRSMRGYDG